MLFDEAMCQFYFVWVKHEYDWQFCKCNQQNWRNFKEI